jgi:hypothetical protein
MSDREVILQVYEYHASGEINPPATFCSASAIPCEDYGIDCNGCIEHSAVRTPAQADVAHILRGETQPGSRAAKDRGKFSSMRKFIR